MKLQKINLGFTLIELLVVITIIGILATGATAIYSSQIQKARDTTRVNDIIALQSSIEQFYQDTTEYPLGKSDWTASGSTSVVQYLPNLAQDPKYNQTCDGSQCGYIYTVNDDDNGITNGTYEISTAFENAGNISSKAQSAQDNGDDNDRLEIGLDTNTNDTTGSGAFTHAAADDTSDTLVIKKGDVVLKGY